MKWKRFYPQHESPQEFILLEYSVKVEILHKHSCMKLWRSVCVCARLHWRVRLEDRIKPLQTLFSMHPFLRKHPSKNLLRWVLCTDSEIFQSWVLRVLLSYYVCQAQTIIIAVSRNTEMRGIGLTACNTYLYCSMCTIADMLQLQAGWKAMWSQISANHD